MPGVLDTLSFGVFMLSVSKRGLEKPMNRSARRTFVHVSLVRFVFQKARLVESPYARVKTKE